MQTTIFRKNTVYGRVLSCAGDLGRRRHKDLLLASTTSAKNAAAAERFDRLPDGRCRAGARTGTFAYGPTKSSIRFFARPSITTNTYPCPTGCFDYNSRLFAGRLKKITNFPPKKNANENN